MFAKYYKADGTDQDWPKAGDDFPRAGSDYITRFGQMEARFRLDLMGPGIENSLGNPGVNQWSAKGWTLTLSRLQRHPVGHLGRCHKVHQDCSVPLRYLFNEVDFSEEIIFGFLFKV